MHSRIAEPEFNLSMLAMRGHAKRRSKPITRTLADWFAPLHDASIHRRALEFEDHAPELFPTH